MLSDENRGAFTAQSTSISKSKVKFDTEASVYRAQQKTEKASLRLACAAKKRQLKSRATRSSLAYGLARFAIAGAASVGQPTRNGKRADNQFSATEGSPGLSWKLFIIFGGQKSTQSA